MGTELCCDCDEPTGRAGAGDDSIYTNNHYGPLCESCAYDGIALDNRIQEIEQLTAQVQRMQSVVDAAQKFYEAPNALTHIALDCAIEEYNAQPSDEEITVVAHSYCYPCNTKRCDKCEGWPCQCICRDAQPTDGDSP